MTAITNPGRRSNTGVNGRGVAHVPFVIATAGTRRQLQVEVELFNVCKLLNILLHSHKHKSKHFKNQT